MLASLQRHNPQERVSFRHTLLEEPGLDTGPQSRIKRHSSLNPTVSDPDELASEVRGKTWFKCDQSFSPIGEIYKYKNIYLSPSPIPKTICSLFSPPSGSFGINHISYTTCSSSDERSSTLLSNKLQRGLVSMHHKIVIPQQMLISLM